MLGVKFYFVQISYLEKYSIIHTCTKNSYGYSVFRGYNAIFVGTVWYIFALLAI